MRGGSCKRCGNEFVASRQAGRGGVQRFCTHCTKLRENENRRGRYVSRAATRVCVDCDAVLVKRGPRRCVAHRAAHAQAYNAKKNAAWVRANPSKNRVRRARRRARLLHAEGHHANAAWLAMKARYGNRCLCCGRMEPDITLQPDHVVPLAKGGSDWIWNIQPLCKSCNVKKRLQSTDYRETLVVTVSLFACINDTVT